MRSSDLIEYLPHRPPMVWVDKVVDVGDDYKMFTGTISVEIDKKALYVCNGKELRASAAIEFTAQAFGYLKAAYQVKHNFSAPPTVTYLAGVRSCKSDFSGLDLDQVTELHVSIQVKRELLPVTYIEGVVRESGKEEILAIVEIQVYVD